MAGRRRVLTLPHSNKRMSPPKSDTVSFSILRTAAVAALRKRHSHVLGRHGMAEHQPHPYHGNWSTSLPRTAAPERPAGRLRQCGSAPDGRRKTRGRSRRGFQAFVDWAGFAHVSFLGQKRANNCPQRFRLHSHVHSCPSNDRLLDTRIATQPSCFAAGLGV